MILVVVKVVVSDLIGSTSRPSGAVAKKNVASPSKVICCCCCCCFVVVAIWIKGKKNRAPTSTVGDVLLQERENP